MDIKYLFRLVLANGDIIMLASTEKTRTAAWRQASNLKETLGATNIEVWGAHNLTLIMEIKSK